MDKRFVVIILLLLSSSLTYSQGEIDDQQRIFYRDEKTIALLLNTSGLGINLSHAKRIDGYKKVLYQIDLVEIKHPKEVKISRQISVFESRGRYVYGKLNKFFNIRTGVGKQKEIYRKIDKGGVSIRRCYTGGLNLGFEKPVYYIMQDYLTPTMTKGVERKFDTEQHASNDIERYASFFKGFNELKVVPGLFAKYSYMFEYGKYDEVIHAIEGGIIVDVFPRPINLMAHNDNNFLFVSLYISYRFGKVVDSRFNYRKNKIDRLLSE